MGFVLENWVLRDMKNGLKKEMFIYPGGLIIAILLKKYILNLTKNIKFTR